MKKIRKKTCFLMLFFILFMPGRTYAAQTDVTAFSAADTDVGAAAARNGLVKCRNGRYCFYYKGKKLKNTWRTVAQKQYYFGASGYCVTTSINLKGTIYVFNSEGQLYKPSRRRIYKSKGYYYCVNSNGTADAGWIVVNNRLYLANTRSGRIYTNRTYKGIALGSNGAAKINTASRLKIKTMSAVASITKKGMTKSQKLYACWKYLVNSGKFRYWSFSPNISKRGWQKECALSMLIYYRGSCSNFACAFAALAAEVGYDPYIVYGRVPGSRDGAADGMTRHCWVMISEGHYDPEGAYAGWSGFIYGKSYYPIYHTVTQTVNFTDWY